MPDNWWDEFKSNRWKAENAKDQIHGEVTERKRGETGKGEAYPIIVIGRGVEAMEVHASAIDLQIKLADAEPQIGDRVRITLTGYENTGRPKPMKVFRVEVRRREEHATTDHAEGGQRPGEPVPGESTP